MLNIISLYFIAFFIILSVVYYCIPKKFQWLLLLTGSLVFYLSSDIKFFVFLLMSITTTFFAAKIIHKLNKKITINENSNCKKFVRQKRLVMIGTLLLNVGTLAFLKFFNYFTIMTSKLFSILGFDFNIEMFNLILPLGISFYTLQVIGYCIDVYRGKYKPQNNFAKYMLFVSFFPQILQGPIARYDALGDQLFAKHKFDYVQIKFGLQLMLWGYFKKMVIADRAAILVNEVFGNSPKYSGIVIIVASIFYALQLYTDFSGCVDIVTGGAQVLGIKLAPNFNKPYFATSIQDFWHRWHISLSLWLKDYLYIPLGGSRKGKFRKYLNIMVVFFVSGLWHGTGLHYIAWGILHGGYQVCGAVFMPLRQKTIKLFKIDINTFSHKLFKTLFTFLLVDFAWVFFRADSLTIALKMIKSIARPYQQSTPILETLHSLGLNTANFNLLIVCVLMLILISYLQTKFFIREKLAKQNLWFRWLIYFGALTAVIIFGIYGPGFDSNQFIYLHF
ncbi:MAG: MBOAT family O-acyltransferase [Oscillospiraceae bacterium]